MKKRKSLDPALLAKMMRKPQDRAAMGVLLAQIIETLEVLSKLLGQVTDARFKDWHDPPVVQRRRRAADIKREHAMLTDQLRRSGVPKPAAQAWEDLARRYRTSVGALSRSVRARNR